MTQWIHVCDQSDLVENSGVCALIENKQIALFYLPAEKQVFALANFDPFGDANVLSRGLIASMGEELYVASPLYKQHFCLRTGHCLEDSEMSIQAWSARCIDGRVEISL